MVPPANQRAQNDDRQIRRCLLLGIAVWFLQLNTAYALSSLSCVWGWFNFTFAGLSGLQWVELSISLMALLVMLGLIYVPWRKWRQYQTQKPTKNNRMLHETEVNRRPFLAFIVMLLNSLFCLFIIASFVPTVALNVCGQA